MSIGENLRKYRNEKKMSQEDVAQKLFVTRQTVSRWELEKNLPNLYVLEDLSLLYEVPIEKFFDKELQKEEQAQPLVEEHMGIGKKVALAIYNSVINLFLFFSIGIGIYGFLIVFWFLNIIFIVSPLILFVASFFNMSITIGQVLLSVIFMVIGLTTINLLKRITILIMEVTKRYIRYSKK